MTSTAKITGLLVKDPIAGPAARKSRSGLVWEKPVEGGVALYFHENPGQSQLPLTGSKEFRKLLEDVDLESYPPKEEKPKAKISGLKGPAKKEEES